jgi:hypothetical protein
MTMVTPTHETTILHTDWAFSGCEADIEDRLRTD